MSGFSNLEKMTPAMEDGSYSGKEFRDDSLFLKEDIHTKSWIGYDSSMQTEM